jgi:hypothetical protein
MSKKKPKIKSILLIVEDNSDFISFKKLISRIIEKDNLPFKKAIGGGCGKMKRKAVSYASNLSKKGCDLIILAHDLDRNDANKLSKELTLLMTASPARYNFVCIPIEEIEGWFLSDPEGIKQVFNLSRQPKIKGNPETIASPKEKLEEYIYQCSNKSKIYLNTKHNDQLSESLCIEKMKTKCKSFAELYNHVKLYQY